MERPTLEAQIAWDKEVKAMTREDAKNWLMGGDNWYRKLNFLIFRKSHFLWSIIHWNWFCIWCGRKHFYFTTKKCETDYFRRKGY